jgi:hypothetical protein
LKRLTQKAGLDLNGHDDAGDGRLGSGESALRLPRNEKYTHLGNDRPVLSEDLKSCLDAGCNGYIVKPFNGVDLQRKIRELLVTKELPA